MGYLVYIFIAAIVIIAICATVRTIRKENESKIPRNPCEYFAMKSVGYEEEGNKK